MALRYQVSVFNYDLYSFTNTLLETQRPLDTSTYMTELINQSILCLRDRSYPIADEKTCREEYLSLISLQALTPQMVKTEFLHGPFKLYNPDIRLGNIIADADYKIKAFIDWDFVILRLLNSYIVLLLVSHLWICLNVMMMS
jgi:hypothetical protein